MFIAIDALNKITIYEVSPRDGLQNLDHIISTKQKLQFIRSLQDAGLQHIEVTSFAHPQRIPQMADAEEVFQGQGSVLVMNQRGMDRALSVGATHFNIVYSPSEEFNQRNLGCDLNTAIDRYAKMLDGVPKENVRVYLSCFFGCPYEGEMSKSQLTRSITAAKLLGSTVVLCDTVGIANLSDIREAAMMTHQHDINAALHLHHKEDRLDHALSLVRVAIENGITEFDSSIGGLGGCPFIIGTCGNLPTESLVVWANANGFDCGLTWNDLKEPMRLARDIREGFFVEVPSMSHALPV
tara:strand:+ start:1616 stop:2503 length:888 start_codon:yes stop_codon:yes gene_type:complete